MIATWPAEATPLRRVLELAEPVLPRASRAAEAALGEALAGTAASQWPEVAWKHSSITGDGFPVEFTFSSSGAGLRYTAEIAGPEIEERRRFRAALEWAGRSALNAGIIAQAAQLQQGPLQWGAWVGGFHSESRNRRKVYFETGPACPAIPGLPAGALLQFAGAAAGEPDAEYYFRKDFLEVSEAGRLLCGMSLRECIDPLCESIRNTLPWPVREKLIQTDSGFSVVRGAFSVFTYARSVWGGDGSIRRRILELGERNGWDFSLYEKVTEPLECAEGPHTHHGILAWITAPGRPVELRISLRPPAAA